MSVENLKAEDVFQRMHEWSDDSGCSELQYVNEIIKDTQHNERFDKGNGELNADSVDMLDATLAELVEAANAAREHLAKLRKEVGI